jgi:hypothetical protein
MGANSIVNKNRLNRLSADPKSLRNTVEEIENGEKAFEKRKQEIINASQQSLVNDLKKKYRFDIFETVDFVNKLTELNKTQQSQLQAFLNGDADIVLKEEKSDVVSREEENVAESLAEK